MHEVVLNRRVIKFIDHLPKKHQKQIKNYILSFQEEPTPHDSQTLKGYEPYRRGDYGEYRIVYRVSEPTKTVHVILIGKRNDSDVYQQLKSLLS